MKCFFLLGIGILFGFSGFSQVGINNTNPKASLDITATNQATPSNTDGILIPRIDDFPATNPTAAQQGMMVYLTTTSGSNPPGFYYWDNNAGPAAWISVVGGTVQKLDDLIDGKSDNDGTNDGSSVFLGINAGANDDSTDNKNIGIGFETLQNNTNGDYNVAIGYQSQNNDFSGQRNISLGYQSLYTNITGTGNIAIGHQAGFSNNGGQANVFLGYYAGFSETGSNKLYIENSNADADNALIYGEFDTNILRTNGELQIGNPTGTGYAFPTVDGVSGQVLRSNGSGNLSWATLIPNTDDQIVDQFGLVGTTLGISLEDDGMAPVTVDLSSLAGDDDWTDVGADIERQTGDVFIGDNNTTDNDLYISNRIIDWDNTSYYLNPNDISKVDEISFDSGSASDPSIRFSSSNTGFFSPASNTMAYTANGIEAFRISNAGKIGIGTVNPNTLYNLTSISGIANNAIKIGPTNTSDPLVDISSIGDGTKGINVSLTSGNSVSDKKILVGSLSGLGYSSYLGYLQGSSSTLYGLYNNKSGSLPSIGVYNSSSGTLSNSALTSKGMYNYVITTGSGNFTGMENRVNNSLSGTIKGVYNYFTSNSSGTQFGVHTIMSSPNTGTKYGTYIDISNSAGGTHYGVYSDVQKSSGYAGYFIGRMSLGNSTSNRYFMPASDGTTNQVIRTDGSGNLSWVTPSMNTDNQQVDLFSLSGTTLGISLQNDGVSPVTVDLSSLQDADWYESGTTNSSNNINASIFTQGKVGIGTNDPNSGLNLIYTSDGGSNPAYNRDGMKIDYTHTRNTGIGVGLNVNAKNNGNGSNIAGGYFRLYDSNNGNSSTAVFGLNVANSVSNEVFSGSSTGNGTYNYGVRVSARNASDTNIGGSFTSNSSIGKNYGVLGYALGSTTNWAGYFGDTSTIPAAGSGNVFVQDLLQVDGALKFTNGAANNYILKSDASGNATWADPTTVGTDDQNISGSGLSGTTLTIGIENGSSETVNLSSLQDADWYESGGTPPNSINDNIYTNGNVGIGTTAISNAALHIKKNGSGSSPQLNLEENQANDGARINFTNTAETTNTWTLYGRTDNTSTSNYFNVYSSVGGNIITVKGEGKVGINRTPTSNSFEVNGTASKTTAGSWVANSDRRLKKNIVNISGKDALEKILKMKGVTYFWNDDKTGINRPTNIQYGFIAQDLMKVFPTKVTMDNLGYYQTAYGDYDPIFVEAIKELYTKIETLKEENQQLKQQLKKYEDLEARLTALENNNQPQISN